ncbi:YraN family protein [Butyrivibrio sp. NC2002]|jgi:putative endonuclease|uniref:YraN family protein n=1 Tax=Butyrivibrio sp. NC2002 TaxID=1410610 RepID=UPI00068B6355|nr:YraN family protein [Butyrivibrio sp. NC2002]
MNKREIGNYYESLVCEFIKEKGYSIVERNFRCKSGEVDIIAKDGRYLIFIEVKFRTGTGYGSAEYAVDHRKMRTICRVSDFYCKRYSIGENHSRRYDVAAINISESGAATINYIENAFEYISEGVWRNSRCRMF